MSKILHTADIHIQQPHDQRWQALEAVIKTAQKEAVDFLVISGDLFDQNFAAQNARVELRELFTNTSFQTLLLPGNHDAAAYQQGLYFGQDAVVFNQPWQKLEHDELVFWGLPFTPLDSTEMLSKLNLLRDKLDPKKTNLILFHGELLDSFFNQADYGEEGGKRYMPLRLGYFQDLAVDYVLAGHFHTTFQAHLLPNNRLEQGGYFIYPGSPVSVTKKELGVRQANLFETGGKPTAVELETNYFKELIKNLSPFDPEDPIDQLKDRLLSHNAAQVQLLLKVTGFFDAKAMGRTEQDLQQELSQLIQDYPGQAELIYQAQDISQITQDPLFQTMSQEIIDSEAENQAQLNQLLIEAMMRVKHEN